MQAPFGSLADGRPAACFTLENEHLRVRITDFGARMVSIEMPDRNGAQGHILLGFENAAAYQQAGGSFGAVLGRCANRIGQGRFTLDGETYQLAVNDGGNTLHGGPQGFGEVMWKLERYSAENCTLVLSHISPDGDQGFPGDLSVWATYHLEGPALHLILEAATDRPTIVNLSAHPYFNLAGAAAGDCLGHEIAIAADRFVVTGPGQIPTGELRPVADSPFDFRAAKPLARDIRSDNEQLLAAHGYDHCFVMAPGPSGAERFMASAYEPRTGRMLKLFSDQPGLQLYSGNMLDGSILGRDGIIYRQSAGFAFEAQNFPDAPNHPDFPGSVLRPGEAYRRAITYAFSA